MGLFDYGYYTYEEKQYYQEAFEADITRVWQFAPFNFNQNERHSLCYHSALSCFYKKDYQSLIDRRELLYYYLSKDFDINNSNNTLNRFKTRLPINSVVHKILNNICTAYNEEPRRIFSMDSKVDETMNKIYSLFNVDNSLKEVYHLASFAGKMALKPTYVNDILLIQTFTPDRYRVILNEEKINQVDAIIIPEYSSFKEGMIYHYWNDKEYILYNKDKKVIKREVNSYGKIPFVFLSFGESEEFYGSGEFELIEEQLKLNVIEFLKTLNIKYQSLPIAIATNGQGKIQSVTPDRIINLVDVSSEADGYANPSLEFIAPDSVYSELEMEIQTLRNTLMRNFGIPNSMIESNGNVTSGISRIIERQELIERREADLPILRSFEKDLANMIRLVTLKDNNGNYGLNENEFTDFSIDFSEERMYLEPDVEREQDKQKMKEGLLDPINYIQKWSDFDSNMSENKLIKELERRKELYKKLFGSEEMDNPDTQNNEQNINNSGEEIDSAVTNNEENIQIEKDKIENAIV